jgi:hypothetical protein
MQYGLETYHPFSQFDLAAIGIVLVMVMLVMAIRRVARMILGSRGTPARESELDSDHVEHDMD